MITDSIGYFSSLGLTGGLSGNYFLPVFKHPGYYSHVTYCSNKEDDGTEQSEYLYGARLAEQERKEATGHDQGRCKNAKTKLLHWLVKPDPAVDDLNGVVHNQAKAYDQCDWCSDVHIDFENDKYQYQESERNQVGKNTGKNSPDISRDSKKSQEN